MTLSEIKAILARENISLTKSLGQHFLHDQNQLRRIVDAADLSPTDSVLEIGPGLGPLTELLLEKAGKVLAIETDRRLVKFLEHRFASQPKLTIRHADALRLLRDEKSDWHDWKVVSNLPYSVASPILVELAQSAQRPVRIVVTLQREVVQRLVAHAGSKDYGLLSLYLQLRYEPSNYFLISSGSFFPSPDVESACVTLIRREKPLLDEPYHRAFEKIVRRGFSQRRKMMLKLLKTEWPESALTSAFEQIGLHPQIRAEKVTLEQFVRLTELLSNNNQPSAT